MVRPSADSKVGLASDIALAANLLLHHPPSIQSRSAGSTTIAKPSLLSSGLSIDYPRMWLELEFEFMTESIDAKDIVSVTKHSQFSLLSDASTLTFTHLLRIVTISHVTLVQVTCIPAREQHLLGQRVDASRKLQ